MWAIDFQFDETADRRRLKLANIVDEFTSEALAIRVGRSCTADQLVETIEAVVAAARRSRRCAHGYRPGDDRLGAAGMVPSVGRADHLHRTPPAAGEPFRRVLQHPPARRTAQPRGVRRSPPGQGDCRGLADREQHTYRPTRPSAGSPPTSSPRSGRSNTNQNSCSSWTYFRGPRTPNQPPEPNSTLLKPLFANSRPPATILVLCIVTPPPVKSWRSTTFPPYGSICGSCRCRVSPVRSRFELCVAKRTCLAN